MNPAEAVMLVRYVRALCPQQKFDEYTPDAWYDVLGQYSLAEARAAVGRRVTAGHVFVAVGEVVTEIRRTRNDRLDRHAESEPPTGDTGDETYQAALLTERIAVADGRTEPRQKLDPPGSRAELRPGGRTMLAIEAAADAATQAMPSRRAGVVNVLGVPCPMCASPAGKTCRSRRQTSRADAHPARLEDAKRAAAGLPPVDRAEVEREQERRLEASRAALAALPPGVTIEPDDGWTPDGPRPKAKRKRRTR